QLKDSLQSLQSLDLEQSKNPSLNELRLKEIELGFLDNRLKNEKQLYESQIQLPTKESESKTNELLACRKENNEKVLESNMKIEEQANEINNLKLEINRLRKLNEKKESSNEEMSKKLLELQVNCSKLESAFNKE